MSGLRRIYLGLAIVGAIWPLLPILIWFAENGWSLARFQDDWQAYSDSFYFVSGLSGDLIIAEVTLGIWATAETLVRKNWSALWAIPVTFLVGISCGLPLYLFLRTRPVT